MLDSLRQLLNTAPSGQVIPIEGSGAGPVWLTACVNSASPLVYALALLVLITVIVKRRRRGHALPSPWLLLGLSTHLASQAIYHGINQTAVLSPAHTLAFTPHFFAVFTTLAFAVCVWRYRNIAVSSWWNPHPSGAQYAELQGECTHLAGQLANREASLALAASELDRLLAQEEKNDRHERRFQRAFHTASIGIAEISLAGDFLTVNEAYTQILGYSRRELLSLSPQDITHPDDLAEDLAQIDSLLSGKTRSDAMDKRFIRKDGTVIWVQLIVSVVDDQHGRPAYFIAVAQDITSRKEAESELELHRKNLEINMEQRSAELSNAVAALRSESEERHSIEGKLASSNHKLKSIIEGTSDLIAAIDLNYHFITFNTAYRDEFYRNFGLNLNIGDSLLEVLSQSLGSHTQQISMWERALAGEQFTIVDSFSRDTDSANPNIFEITFNRIVDVNNELVGAAHIGRDVTARIAAENTLEKAKLEAEQANATKTMFLANVSHEIRTPIGVILGYADMLLRPEISSKERFKFTSKIKRNGQNLLAIVNDILDLSKVESGHLSIEKELVCLLDFVADIIMHMRSYAEKKGLMLTWSVQSLIPQSVYTDSHRLRQILYNLLNNAIKFTDAGCINLALRLRSGDEPAAKKMLEFIVSDTGVGIASNKQDKLFQPFSQADDSVSRKYGGTGLGLSLSRQLANRLGGDVVLVRSSPLAGSVFTASIDPGPITAGELIRVDSTHSIERHLLEGQQRVEMTSTNFASVPMLLVEDFEDNQELYRSILGEAGAIVDVAENGQVALEKIARNNYKIIVMDMQMPVLDGYTTTQQLRNRGFDRPILALTANAMRGEMERCIAAGCNDFLTKPVEGGLLLDTIARLLGPTLPRESSHEVVREQKPTPPPPLLSKAEPYASSSSFAALASDQALLVVVQAFVKKLPSRMRAMRLMYENADIDGVRSLAHQLRGAGGGYGFPEITDCAAKIEQCQDEGEELISSIEHLSLVCDRIHEHLRPSP